MSPSFDANIDTLLLFPEPLFFVQNRADATFFTKASKMRSPCGRGRRKGYPELMNLPHLCLQSFDDGDSRLDSTEFLKFVEQNETAVNITTYMDQETNKLLRWAVDGMPGELGARCGRKGHENPLMENIS